jgi:hypothetical protein
MLKKRFDVVYHDEFGNKELINSFNNYSEAYQCYMKCMKSDHEAQINQSYDIEESYTGVPC